MGRTACTEPQCLYKGALYLYPLPSGEINVINVITEELLKVIFRYKTEEVTQAWDCMRGALCKIPSW